MNFVFNQSGEGNTQIGIVDKASLGWVKTADRLPTEADAGVDEEIVTIYDDGDTRMMGVDYWKCVALVPGIFPYWLPVPKLPEVEGMTRSDNPCATCSNRDCANSLLAKWWDLCVESNFTLFKQIDPPPSGAIGPEQDGTAPNGNKGAES